LTGDLDENVSPYLDPNPGDNEEQAKARAKLREAVIEARKAGLYDTLEHLSLDAI